VNVLGHSQVALGVGVDEPAYVLGAVLPDLASIARARLHKDRLPGEIAAGVRCHVVADAAFHLDATFERGSAAIRDELRERGLGAGPARAIGHVGWELLLDGTLLASAARDVYARALELGDEARAGFAGDDTARWDELMIHRRRLPDLPYDDPEWVAERMEAMLAPRALLRFPPEQLPEVTATLVAHADRIVAAAPQVIEDTTRRTAERLVSEAAAAAPRGR
jgi:hypothetical protein